MWLRPFLLVLILWGTTEGTRGLASGSGSGSAGEDDDAAGAPSLTTTTLSKTTTTSTSTTQSRTTSTATTTTTIQSCPKDMWTCLDSDTEPCAVKADLLCTNSNLGGSTPCYHSPTQDWRCPVFGVLPPGLTNDTAGACYPQCSKVHT